MVRLIAWMVLLAGCSATSNENKDGGFDYDADADTDADSDADSDVDTDADGDIDFNVGQGGAQDFGLFKQILEDGEIPGPTTLDDVGFFNEHRIDFGDADCGENVCIHGTLGMMGNMVSGSPCTIVMLGMNTPIDPDEVARPPLNLAIAVDGSGSMGGQSIDYVKSGLKLMFEALHPNDVVHLIRFNQSAEVLAENAHGEDEDLFEVVDDLSANGSTNIYAGLELAYQTMQANADPERQNRVILLSDGQATSGITDPASILGMSADYNLQGYSLTTIGMGSNFDVTLMQDLSEQGSGAFYFLQDTSAVEEVFVEEVEAFLIPLAQEVDLELQIDSGWSLRQVYGTKLSLVAFNEATIKIPTLQIAHRTSDSTEGESGRRGGGGAIIAEVLPTSNAGQQVGHIEFSYTDPVTGETVEQTVDVDTPVGPEGQWFANGPTEKAFVMLNLYVGFWMAADAASRNADGEALGILYNLKDGVEDWLVENEDDDIADDLVYLDLFIGNLEERTNEEPEEPEEDPWD